MYSPTSDFTSRCTTSVATSTNTLVNLEFVHFTAVYYIDECCFRRRVTSHKPILHVVNMKAFYQIKVCTSLEIGCGV